MTTTNATATAGGRSGNPFIDATRELGPCIVMEPEAFAATFFPPHHDEHVKRWHLERKLAASAHITTEMLLADLRRAS